MLDHNLVLKSDELYLVGNISTDGSGERATGLYVRDTRHLSTFAVTLNDTKPDRLAVRIHGANRATVTLTNPMLTLPGDDMLLPQCLMLEERVELDGKLAVEIILQNFSTRRVALKLGLEIAADFRDLFDIRGFHRKHRGVWKRPTFDAREIVLSYTGLDGVTAQTAISFDREGSMSFGPIQETETAGYVALLPGKDDLVWESQPAQPPAVRAAFEVELQAGERWNLMASVEPRLDRQATRRPHARPTALDSIESARISTSNPLFDQILDRSIADMAELQTHVPEGSLPAAGIPWYVAPFGRDSLIASLQTLHLAPRRSIETLRVLAALQGTVVDDRREEEPGKILHEMRYGEMARLAEIPHTPYYGTVDATPLWLWLFIETVSWTGDRELYDELLPNVRKALEWIEHYGDLDGDGLVEYRMDRIGTGRITHQVWKDSFDSLNFPDGTPPIGPIAAVEVQGYVYRAYTGLAILARVFGGDGWAMDLEARAERVRIAVESNFWMENAGFYGQALDGNKRLVPTISSNPGHLLACGLPSPERAIRMADRLRQPDLESGWGIRTLSSTCATFNPMSYHNGSIWPHDNSLIGGGLYAYGRFGVADAISGALFAAARKDPLDRLPELYCGFARSDESNDAPVAYPVSCTPQAWAAGALPFLVRSMLGLRVDLAERKLIVDPHLPDWLDSITLHELTVLGCRGTLTVRRDGDRYAVQVDEMLGPVIAQESGIGVFRNG